MSSIITLIAAVGSFIIAALLGKVLVPYLHKLKFGQNIKVDFGPQWHKNKQGTPTMGGFMFIIASVAVTIICVLIYGFTGEETYPGMGTMTNIGKVLAGLAMAVAYGAIGFIDDYISVVKKRNLGLTAKQKLVLQFLVAAAYLLTLFLMGNTSVTIIPFAGSVDLGWFYWIFSAIFIVGIVNATNLTDGIDGLNGSVTFFVALAFMLISTYIRAQGFAIMAAALAGGCLGFLVWNFHPAKVFMGDTGSLFLGGFVCALAFGINMPILLIPLGFVYLCEMFSVMLQVSYFKLTHGKRLFKMSPIHHHFEMCGWSETKIVAVFSIVTAIFGVLSFLSVMFGVFA